MYGLWEILLCVFKPNYTAENTHTQGRNPMNVTNVGNPPPVSQPYVSIRRSTRKRNPINALSVGNPAAISQP